MTPGTPAGPSGLSRLLLKDDHGGATVDGASAERLIRLARIYETILSTTDDFAYVFDTEGRFLYANTRLLTVWAKTLDQIVGKTCHELGYPDWHADMHMREIREVVETKRQIRGEVPFTGASGISGIYDYIFQPVLDASGQVEMIVGTTRDVTERKRNEERLRQAQMDLQKKAEELELKVAERTASLRETIGDLEAFSYSIVHDMRGPLRSMQGYTNILATEYVEGFDPEAMLYLERINKASIRMDHLIRDVLAFSRVARQEIELAPVNTVSLLRDIIDCYPDMTPQKENIRVEDSLPVVLGNEAALTQCFSNLLGNAVRFARPGQAPQIHVWGAPAGELVRLHFDDQGIGIPERLHERIFELFQRGSDSGEGTGIGLAIVKKAVERMGGRVGVKSKPGEGSSFWLELPAAKGEAVAV